MESRAAFTANVLGITNRVLANSAMANCSLDVCRWGREGQSNTQECVHRTHKSGQYYGLIRIEVRVWLTCNVTGIIGLIVDGV